MKKDGIQTRNRKLSAKSKGSEVAKLLTLDSLKRETMQRDWNTVKVQHKKILVKKLNVIIKNIIKEDAHKYAYKKMYLS